MNIDLNNLNPSRPDSSRSNSTRNDAVSRDSGSSEKASAQAPADNVSLSETAKTLASVEAQLKESPEVDLSKVEAIRARLESGEYQINSDNMAQKMLDIES